VGLRRRRRSAALGAAVERFRAYHIFVFTPKGTLRTADVTYDWDEHADDVTRWHTWDELLWQETPVP